MSLLIFGVDFMVFLIVKVCFYGCFVGFEFGEGYMVSCIIGVYSLFDLK